MNKAFKIIWNTARGGYVVASEMQRAHGKTSRVKTAAAFALAGALALSATVTAKTITNDNIQKETTTKLVSGDGELYIETAGDLRQLAQALKTGKLDQIREALGVGSNPENRGIYTQSDSSKKSSRNIWSLAVVSVDQRY